jgi:uncharacterized protein
MNDECNGTLHLKAVEGLKLFNAKKYFEAHEELEVAWREEKGEVRNLYRAILQAAVVYLHITRGNYPGAIKVYERCEKWLNNWPDVCRGIQVGKLRKDLADVINKVKMLGEKKINEFDRSLIRQVEWMEK